MSMCLCSVCKCLIDTDDEPEAFIEETDLILCETHREERDEERTRYAYEDYLADRGDAAAEQEWLDARHA